VIRTAPESGYDFGNKKQYRRNIWRTFKQYCGMGTRYADALLMPSAEGAEIDVALNNGFHEGRLSICDSNPAIVATLKRRYPLVETYGVSVGAAAMRRVKQGLTWDVANLDLCSCVGDLHYAELMTFGRSGCMPCGLVTVTMLRGREQRAVFSVVREGGMGSLIGIPERLDQECWSEKPEDISRTDMGRITTCGVALSGSAQCPTVYYKHGAAGRLRTFDNGRTNIVYLERSGTYRSVAGTQTMLWACFRIHRMPCVCDLCALFLREELRRWFGYGEAHDVILTLSAQYGMSREDLVATSERLLSRHPMYRGFPNAVDAYRQKMTIVKRTRFR
jgi:hypothetical protein